ncbi:hypothetical protein E2C01_091705 [Portunus trituberculatus]|uniref:Uncharacterized protein n=1 Tax=Portunus trituberculatus TaxID=210409 RepID=A0A5B7JQ35_PORTR|nr:hypothetical protein [Portunus trituberculatus]
MTFNSQNAPAAIHPELGGRAPRGGRVLAWRGRRGGYSRKIDLAAQVYSDLDDGKRGGGRQAHSRRGRGAQYP